MAALMKPLSKRLHELFGNIPHEESDTKETHKCVIKAISKHFFGKKTKGKYANISKRQKIFTAHRNDHMCDQ